MKNLLIYLVLTSVVVTGCSLFKPVIENSANIKEEGQEVEQIINVEESVNTETEKLSVADSLDTLDTCNSAPTVTEIGSNLYPIAKKYEKLEKLGQIFTAATCDRNRLEAIFKDVYIGYGEGQFQGSAITLSKNPSPELIAIFKEIGYKCAKEMADEMCRKWWLNTSVEVNDLLKLEPYTEFFEYDDCVNCG